jgi:hypothetical protein
MVMHISGTFSLVRILFEEYAWLYLKIYHNNFCAIISVGLSIPYQPPRFSVFPEF